MFNHYQKSLRLRGMRPGLLVACVLAVFGTLTAFMWGARTLMVNLGFRFEMLPVEVMYDPYEDGRPLAEDVVPLQDTGKQAETTDPG